VRGADQGATQRHRSSALFADRAGPPSPNPRAPVETSASTRVTATVVVGVLLTLAIRVSVTNQVRMWSATSLRRLLVVHSVSGGLSKPHLGLGWRPVVGHGQDRDQPRRQPYQAY